MTQAIPGSVRSMFHPTLQNLLQTLKVDFVEPEFVFSRLGHPVNRDSNGTYVASADFISVNSDTSRRAGATVDSVLLHELVHWAGHPARMNRRTIALAARCIDPSRRERALEEATAELGVAKLARALGLPALNMEAQAEQYLHLWGFDSAPICAIQDADQAVNWIMGALAAAKINLDHIAQAA